MEKINQKIHFLFYTPHPLGCHKDVGEGLRRRLMKEFQK